MHLWTRVSIGCLLATAAGTAGWLALRHDVATTVPRTEPSGIEEYADERAATADVVEPPPAPAPAPSAESLVSVEQGAYPWVPAPYREKVAATKTEELAKLLEHWLVDDTSLMISYQRGLVYVESAEDRGDDGPYPRSAQAEAIHACGSQSVWLRSHMRRQLGYVTHFRCAQNICSYDGMEYAPNGNLIFHLRPDGEWELRGWVLDYQAALGEAEQRANAASVHDGLMRLRNATCAGEPDGHY